MRGHIRLTLQMDISQRNEGDACMMKQDSFSIDEINLDGFQVVQRQLFGRVLEPTMTIRASNISFSVAAYRALNNCEAVQLRVHWDQRRIVACPTSSTEPNALTWIKDLSKPKSKSIECSNFTKTIFEMWNWNKALRYCATGRLVRSEQKLMLLFDWNRPITYEKLSR